MHHLIARRTARWAFERLSDRDAQALLSRCSDDIHHGFAGDHALGGERNSKAAFSDWLDRLYRLFPVLSFQSRAILVKGPPWNMIIGVLWTDRGTTADGTDYLNHGVHELTIRWGKLVSLRAHLDSQHLSRVLEAMAQNGIAEAAAPPIEGSS